MESGFWGVGPYENQYAECVGSQFRNFGECACVDAVCVLIEEVLDDPECVGSIRAAQAVAAAALVASQCVGGGIYTPNFGCAVGVLPRFPNELRKSTAAALDAVLGPGSELAEEWSQANDYAAWRREVAHIRDLLRGDIGGRAYDG